MQDLFNLFNDVWEAEVLPNNWKLSTVALTLSPGNSLTNTTNLRPIFLTTNLSKEIERKILIRITWILVTNNKSHPMQTKFRPSLYTQDTLALIHHYIVAPSTSALRTIVAADV